MLRVFIQGFNLSGWIKIHRKIRESSIGRNLELRGLFEELLTRANFKEAFTIDGTKILEGQLMTSQLSLSEFFNVERQKMRRLLLKLENEQLIKQQTSSKNTIITILNWHKYQGDEHQSEHQTNIKRTSNEHQTNINKNEKNEKNLGFLLRVSDIQSLYNQTFTDSRFTRCTVASKSMVESFESVQYLLKTFADWKTYFAHMSKQKFEGISGKIGLPFFLSDKVITNYLNGQYESSDKERMDQLWAEYEKQNEVHSVI